MKIVFLLLSFSTYIVAKLSLQKCPPGPLWGNLAKTKCPNKESYHCLLDTDYELRKEERYKEICLSPRRYKGVQFIYRGNLDARNCSSSRFSPEPTWSNTSTSFECPLIKSSCNEDGQVVAKNGTRDTDRSCRCDYRNMYNYVVKPSDPCHCHPMEEDCSCYIHRCSSTSQVLSQDYECVDKDSTSTFVCSILEEKIMEEVENHVSENITITNSLLDTSSYNIIGPVRERPFNKIAFTLTLTFIVVIVVGLLVAFLWKRCDIPELTNIEEIYRQRMMLSPFYIETKELRTLKQIFEKKKQPRFVILHGMHGTGKTQTSIKFCQDMLNFYSIVAMISSSENISLEQVLVNFLTKDLKIHLTSRSDLTLADLLNELERFLHNDFRKGVRSLLVISFLPDDESFGTIQQFVAVQKRITGLDLIFETNNRQLSSNFPNCDPISFNGMEENEYLELFKDIIDLKRENKATIKTLTENIGTSPLVLVSALRYIKTEDLSSTEYIEKSKIANEFFQTVELYHDRSYEKEVVNLLTIPWKRIETLFAEKFDLWKIVCLIPLLDFRSISVVALDACCRLLTDCSNDIKREMVEDLLHECNKLSLFETVSSQNNMQVETINWKRRENDRKRILCFHTLTIKALEKVNHASKENDIVFLLKLFCYEIDLDARTDNVVSRNLLFLNHAKKLLNKLNMLDCRKDEKIHFYEAYLNCALGSTLLYQRENVELAQKHFKQANEIVLLMVKARQIKYEAVNNCILNYSFDEKFTEEFVYNKRRSCHDIDIIKNESVTPLGVFKEHYLSKEDYEKLLIDSLALPLEQICKTLFMELYLWILQNNARSYNDLSYEVASNDLDEINKIRHKLCLQAIEFCSLAKERFPWLFVCLENDRTIQMILRFSEHERYVKQLKEDFKYFEDLLNTSETDNPYFGFGFLKISPKSNFRHTSLCRRILLKYVLQIFKEVKEEEKSDFCKKGESLTEELLGQLKDLQENLGYKWLSVANRYIQCAQFLQATAKYEQALKYFKEASKFENNRGVFWTRLLKDSYVGQIQCYFKLRKPEKAKDTYNSVKRKLGGKNRESMIKFFKTLYESCKKENIS